MDVGSASGIGYEPLVFPIPGTPLEKPLCDTYVCSVVCKHPIRLAAGTGVLGAWGTWVQLLQLRFFSFVRRGCRGVKLPTSWRSQEGLKVSCLELRVCSLKHRAWVSRAPPPSLHLPEVPCLDAICNDGALICLGALCNVGALAWSSLRFCTVSLLMVADMYASCRCLF